jgi:hypothetical protein
VRDACRLSDIPRHTIASVARKFLNGWKSNFLRSASAYVQVLRVSHSLLGIYCYLAPVKISDAPNFRHRGLNFLRTIDRAVSGQSLSDSHFLTDTFSQSLSDSHFLTVAF